MVAKSCPFLLKNTGKLLYYTFTGLGPKLSLESIAKELHCSLNTVQIWIHWYQESGDIQDEERQGWKWNTSDKEYNNIVTVAKNSTSSSNYISISMNNK